MNSAKKGNKKKSNIDWWKDRIKDLKGHSEKCLEYYPEVAKQAKEYEDDEDVGVWAFLKLLTLAYYVSVYTTIAKDYFDKIIYIDLFAGNGFNKLKLVNEVIIGSPLIAKVVPIKETKKGKTKEFDNLIFVEKNPEKVNDLKKLFLPSEALILNEDANSSVVIETIKKYMSKGKNHYFAFIDPYAMQIKWKTLEELLQKNGDLIINFMTTPIQRIWGRYHSPEIIENKPNARQFNDFFGDESWLNVPAPGKGGKAEDLLNLYIEKIKKYRDIVIPIKVKGLKGNFCYHMIVATKRTGGTQRWLDAIYKVKEKVESVKDSDIVNFFDIYNGKQALLEEFY